MYPRAHFQAGLIEDCLSELSALLVLSEGSKNIKSFYSYNEDNLKLRRELIADLFRSEAMRVFRMGWKPQLVNNAQLGAMAFKAYCPEVKLEKRNGSEISAEKKCSASR